MGRVDRQHRRAAAPGGAAAPLHRLSRRFLVFVPAGLALHDHLVLAETAMFRWAAVGAVTQALHDSPALDLTADALGSAVQVTLTAPDTLLLAARRGAGTPEATRADTAAILFSPTLTQALLAEAARRRPG